MPLWAKTPTLSVDFRVVRCFPTSDETFQNYGILYNFSVKIVLIEKVKGEDPVETEWCVLNNLQVRMARKDQAWFIGSTPEDLPSGDRIYPFGLLPTGTKNEEETERYRGLSRKFMNELIEECGRVFNERQDQRKHDQSVQRPMDALPESARKALERQKMANEEREKKAGAVTTGSRNFPI